jgi:hypothetical protein
MITIAQAETQAAKINAVKVLPLQDQDQGRRARLRQRSADDVPHER